jgi:hypothetical protein
MESFVAWWCNLIGITSPGAIEVASGILGASIVICAVWVVLVIVLGLIVR